MPFRNLNVFDAAEQAATRVNALIDRPPPGRELPRQPHRRGRLPADYRPPHDRCVVIVKMLSSLLTG